MKEIKPLLILPAAMALAGIFIYAGIAKAVHPQAFAQAVANYRLLPEPAVNLLALLLPWWEIAAGCALLTRSWRRPGAGLAILLTLSFIGAIGLALLRGLDIECGCFGSNRKAGLAVLAQDAILLALGGWVWRNAGPTGISSETPAGRSSAVPNPD